MLNCNWNMKVSGSSEAGKCRINERVGETKDGEDVSGSITVPEVAHDTEPDEYVVSLLLSRL